MDIRYYEVQQNSDQTEGRGRMVTVMTLMKLDDAVKEAQGRGVMGHGTGDVVEVTITVNNDDTVSVEREEIYGYRRNPNTGKWDYGFKDFRDLPNPQTDPDYKEYLRLKRKFGDQ